MANNKRSFKFYRKNEAEVMNSLGIKPTINSGSGWIEKEDGQNDFVICQLKSTDAMSMKINQNDIRILEKNARVAHKLPIFAIQFLNTGEVWLMTKPEDIVEVSKYIETGSCETGIDLGIDLDEHEELTANSVKTIETSKSARDEFYKNKSARFDKTKSAK